MGFSSVLGGLGSVPRLLTRNDDDAYDRLSYRWTVGSLVIFAIIATSKTYIHHEPIRCWVPQEFPDPWEDYTNAYCYIRNTYYLPWDENIPLNPEDREKNPIIYYQWVPLILMIQALLCYFPISIWRSFNGRAGLDTHDIVQTARKCCYVQETESRDKMMQHIVRQMHRALRPRTQVGRKQRGGGGCCGYNGCKRSLSGMMCSVCGKKFGRYMVTLYITVKVLFLINAVGQLFLLNWFLGQNFSMYGIEVIQAMINGEDWMDSPRFPRVTLCDLKIRRLGNLHTYTIQCVLPINLFNEKMYLFVWFWFLFVAIVTLYGLCLWIVRVSLKREHYTYVQKHLSNYDIFQDDSPHDPRYVRQFVDEYLRADGMLVLRLTDLNTNKMTMEDFLGSMYQYYSSLNELEKQPSIDGVGKDEEDKMLV